MDRRAFLHPRQFARSVGQAAALLHDTAAPAPREIALLRFAREAMATNFEVILPFGTPGAMQVAECALDLIDRLEDQLSVFREHSEISRLNRLAADGPVTLEERLYDLIACSAQLMLATDGAFDITTGALTKAWGFYRREGRVPLAEERADVLQRVGMQHVELDGLRRNVRYLRRGLEINLGSIGKGYALDRAAELLRREGVTVGLIHGGQSSILALGRDPTDARGWAVGVRHPWRPEQRLAVVRLRDRALGTSAATFQHLEYNGKKLGHILDPRSGWPAAGVASATALAPSAAQADALATAFFILGVDRTVAYCQAHSEVGALLLPADESAPVAINLPRESVDLLPNH
jgi:thiamine biosynthesis lipoprotein